MIDKIRKKYDQIEINEIVVAVLLSWSTILGCILRGNVQLNTGRLLWSLTIALIITPLMTVIIHFFIYYLIQLNNIKTSCKKLSNKKRFFITIAILLLCWLPFFLAYYPGIFAYDVGNQMRQVTTGNYHTKHPILHTLLIQFFYCLGKKIHSYTFGIALYSIFQMILLAAIISYTYMEMYRMNIGKIIRYSTFFYYALFPVHAMLSISVTKDVIFSGLVLFFLVLFYKEIKKDKHDKKCIILLIITVLMCLFRNNAIYAFVLTSVFNVLYAIKDKKKRKYIFGFSSIVIIMYFIANFCLIKVMDADKGSIRESLAVPIQQISRTYNYYADELDSDEKNEIEELFPSVEAYNPILADPVKSTANVRENETRIIKLWAHLLVKYPFTYIEAFLYNSFGNWFIDDTSNAYVYDNPGESRRGYLISFCNTEYGVEHVSYLPKLEEICERLFSYNEYQDIPVLRIIFAPALYFWMIVIITVKAWQKRLNSVVFCACFLLAYHFTIMCGPCCLVRYMYPIMISMPFVLSIFLHERELYIEKE